MTRPTVEHVEPDRAEVDAFDRSCLDLAKGVGKGKPAAWLINEVQHTIPLPEPAVRSREIIVSRFRHRRNNKVCSMVLLIADRARVFLKASSVLAAT
jgi:hypothetical protein